MAVDKKFTFGVEIDAASKRNIDEINFLKYGQADIGLNSTEFKRQIEEHKKILSDFSSSSASGVQVNISANVQQFQNDFENVLRAQRPIQVTIDTSQFEAAVSTMNARVESIQRNMLSLNEIGKTLSSTFDNVGKSLDAAIGKLNRVTHTGSQQDDYSKKVLSAIQQQQPRQSTVAPPPVQVQQPTYRQTVAPTYQQPIPVQYRQSAPAATQAIHQVIQVRQQQPVQAPLYLAPQQTAQHQQHQTRNSGNFIAYNNQTSGRPVTEIAQYRTQAAAPVATQVPNAARQAQAVADRIIEAERSNHQIQIQELKIQIQELTTRLASVQNTGATVLPFRSRPQQSGQHSGSFTAAAGGQRFYNNRLPDNDEGVTSLGRPSVIERIRDFQRSITNDNQVRHYLARTNPSLTASLADARQGAGRYHHEIPLDYTAEDRDEYRSSPSRRSPASSFQRNAVQGSPFVDAGIRSRQAQEQARQQQSAYNLDRPRLAAEQERQAYESIAGYQQQIKHIEASGQRQYAQQVAVDSAFEVRHRTTDVNQEREAALADYAAENQRALNREAAFGEPSGASFINTDKLERGDSTKYRQGQSAKAKNRGIIPPEVGPSSPSGTLFHGTSVENAARIKQEGFRIPGHENRQYSYSVFGPDALYFGKDQHWLDPDIAKSSRAAEYQTYVEAQLNPGHRLLEINNEAELNKYSERLGFKAGGVYGQMGPAKSASEDLARHMAAENLNAPRHERLEGDRLDEIRQREVYAKIKEDGYSGLAINYEAEHGLHNQVIVTDPSAVRLKGAPTQTVTDPLDPLRYAKAYASMKQGGPQFSTLPQYDQSVGGSEFQYSTSARQGGYEPNRGWKLHLNVPPDYDNPITKQISDFLVSSDIEHKIAHSSGQSGKGITAYTGSSEDTQKMADLLNSKFGDFIGAPQDDTLNERSFSGKVVGRFNDSSMHGGRNPDLNPYGGGRGQGVPDLSQFGAWSGLSGQARGEKSIEYLSNRYGKYFTGKDGDAEKLGFDALVEASLGTPEHFQNVSVPVSMSQAKKNIAAGLTGGFSELPETKSISEEILNSLPPSVLEVAGVSPSPSVGGKRKRAKGTGPSLASVPTEAAEEPPCGGSCGPGGPPPPPVPPTSRSGKGGPISDDCCERLIGVLQTGFAETVSALNGLRGIGGGAGRSGGSGSGSGKGGKGKGKNPRQGTTATNLLDIDGLGTDIADLQGQVAAGLSPEDAAFELIHKRLAAKGVKIGPDTIGTGLDSLKQITTGNLDYVTKVKGPGGSVDLSQLNEKDAFALTKGSQNFFKGSVPGTPTLPKPTDFQKIADSVLDDPDLGYLLARATGALSGNSKASGTKFLRSQAANAARDKGVADADIDKVTSLITEQNIPKLVNPGNFKNPRTAQNIGIASLYGGLPAAAGAAAGALLPFGAQGALLGSTLVQGFTGLFEAPIAAFKGLEEHFKEAGKSFQQSILSISAILQSMTDVVGNNGPLTGGAIQQQLRFQESAAEKIQTASVTRLRPLGISGATESTFVSGIVSALAQRGIVGNASQVATIAERVGGAIVAQRPSLLENPALLLRDLQDSLSGGALANRTILGQIIKPALQGLGSAKTAGDIVAATNPLADFPTTVLESTNPTAVFRKFESIQEQLFTTGGNDFLKELIEPIKGLTTELSKPEVSEAVGKVAVLTGKISAGFLTTTTVIVDASTKIIQILDKVGSGLTALGLTLPNLLHSVEILLLLKGLTSLGGLGGGRGGKTPAGSVPTTSPVQAAADALGVIGALTGGGPATPAAAPTGIPAVATGLAKKVSGSALGKGLGFASKFIRHPLFALGVLAAGEAANQFQEASQKDGTDSLTLDALNAASNLSQRTAPRAAAEGFLSRFGLGEDYNKFLTSQKNNPEATFRALKELEDRDRKNNINEKKGDVLSPDILEREPYFNLVVRREAESKRLAEIQQTLVTSTPSSAITSLEEEIASNRTNEKFAGVGLELRRFEALNATTSAKGSSNDTALGKDLKKAKETEAALKKAQTLISAQASEATSGTTPEYISGLQKAKDEQDQLNRRLNNEALGADRAVAKRQLDERFPGVLSGDKVKAELLKDQKHRASQTLTEEEVRLITGAGIKPEVISTLPVDHPVSLPLVGTVEGDAANFIKDAQQPKALDSVFKFADDAFKLVDPLAQGFKALQNIDKFFGAGIIKPLDLRLPGQIESENQKKADAAKVLQEKNAILLGGVKDASKVVSETAEAKGKGRSGLTDEIIDNIVSASREVFKHKVAEIELAKKAVALEEQRVSLIQSSFDTRTGIGARGSAEATQTQLGLVAGRQGAVVDEIDRQIAENVTDIATLTKQADSTKNAFTQIQGLAGPLSPEFKDKERTRILTAAGLQKDGVTLSDKDLEQQFTLTNREKEQKELQLKNRRALQQDEANTLGKTLIDRIKGEDSIRESIKQGILETDTGNPGTSVFERQQSSQTQIAALTAEAARFQKELAVLTSTRPKTHTYLETEPAPANAPPVIQGIDSATGLPVPQTSSKLVDRPTPADDKANEVRNNQIVKTQLGIDANNKNLILANRDADRQVTALSEAGIEYREALRSSEEAIKLESSKRKELNNALETSREALRNFGEQAKLQALGKETSLAASASKIKQLGGTIPDFLDLSESDSNALQLRQATAEGNALAREVGLGNIFGAQGKGLGVVNPNDKSTDFGRGIADQAQKLEDSVLKTSTALSRLPDEIEKFLNAIKKATVDFEQKTAYVDPNLGKGLPGIGLGITQQQQVNVVGGQEQDDIKHALKKAGIHYEQGKKTDAAFVADPNTLGYLNDKGGIVLNPNDDVVNSKDIDQFQLLEAQQLNKKVNGHHIKSESKKFKDALTKDFADPKIRAGIQSFLQANHQDIGDYDITKEDVRSDLYNSVYAGYAQGGSEGYDNFANVFENTQKAVASDFPHVDEPYGSKFFGESKQLVNKEKEGGGGKDAEAQKLLQEAKNATQAAAGSAAAVTDATKKFAEQITKVVTAVSSLQASGISINNAEVIGTAAGTAAGRAVVSSVTGGK